MRILSLFLAAALFFFSCKPKNKIPTFTDLVTADSTKGEKKEEKKNVSRHELLIGTWKITDALPNPSESERNEMLNSILEFTSDGKLFITQNGKKEEAATINFSFDDKYLLSQETGHENNIDTLLIQELNLTRLVLVSTKDNRTLIAQRSN